MRYLIQIVVLIFLLLILAVIVLRSMPAASQQRVSCGPMQIIAKHLKEKYDERPVAFGLIGNGNRFVLTASARGTWTALIWRANNNACPFFAGTDYWQRSKDRRARYAPR